MLLPGMIFGIAADVGITMRGKGDKRACKCPFHDDHIASAFLSVTNCFYCSVCTPAHGWSAKTFSEALGLSWNGRAVTTTFVRQRPRSAPPPPSFGPYEARLTWNASYARCRDDDRAVDDRDVFAWIADRGLLESFELGVLGVVPTRGLQAAIAWWPERGYRVVAPLFDAHGEIVSIQARAIIPAEQKVRNPKGSRIAGTVFADRPGQRALAGVQADRVVYGEGLTDMLALSISSPWPVITAPGTGNALNSVGPWANGAEILLALDCDAAGQEAVLPVAQRLREYGARNVRRVEWPDGAKDACDVLAARGSAGLHEFLLRVGGAS